MFQPRCTDGQMRDCPPDKIGAVPHDCCYKPKCATGYRCTFKSAPLNPCADEFVPFGVSLLNPDACSFVPGVSVHGSLDGDEDDQVCGADVGDESLLAGPNSSVPSQVTVVESVLEPVPAIPKVPNGLQHASDAVVPRSLP